MGKVSIYAGNDVENPEGFLDSLTVADKKGGEIEAYKLSTFFKFSWKYTHSQTTKQPSSLAVERNLR